MRDFKWQDLGAAGITSMGKALFMVAEELKMPPMTDRALPPVLVMLSDGQPTDDFEEGLKALMDLPWGQKSVRVAIGIGQDANNDVLQKFIGHIEMPVLQANNPDALVQCIRWVSTVVLGAASSPASQPEGDMPSNGVVPIPVAPNLGSDQSQNVW